MTRRSRLGRPLSYVLVAVAFAAIVGYFQQGSIGGGLVFGFAVGLGVAIGIVLFETFDRWRSS